MIKISIALICLIFVLASNCVAQKENYEWGSTAFHDTTIISSDVRLLNNAESRTMAAANNLSILKNMLMYCQRMLEQHFRIVGDILYLVLLLCKRNMAGLDARKN
jgi:hypothetical protein